MPRDIKSENTKIDAIVSRSRKSRASRGDADAAALEFGKQVLACFELLDMCDRKRAAKLVAQLVPTASIAEEMAELARVCGAGRFAEVLLEVSRQ